MKAQQGGTIFTLAGFFRHGFSGMNKPLSRITVKSTIVGLLLVSFLLVGWSSGHPFTGRNAGSSETSNIPELQFVSVHNDINSAGNGWNTGKTVLGFLNTGSETICSMSDYEFISSPILTTKEGKDYPIEVDILGKFSEPLYQHIPLSNFPPIPPGFKIYTFGKDMNVFLKYKYAKAANPLTIEFLETDFDSDKYGYSLNTSVDFQNDEFAGEQMVYESIFSQPVKKISDLKGERIAMQDDVLEATFTGECIGYRQKGGSGNLLDDLNPLNKTEYTAFYAVIHVKNTDLLDEYYPESNWNICYYASGGGTCELLVPTEPGMLPGRIGPGEETDLTIPLNGIPVIFQGGCGDEYFILDYSMCGQ